jgi:hypothetical protein
LPEHLNARNNAVLAIRIAFDAMVAGGAQAAVTRTATGAGQIHWMGSTFHLDKKLSLLLLGRYLLWSKTRDEDCGESLIPDSVFS